MVVWRGASLGTHDHLGTQNLAPNGAAAFFRADLKRRGRSSAVNALLEASEQSGGKGGSSV